MSLDALKWAIRQTQIKGDGYKILVNLADRHNPDTGICWPSVDTIMMNCEVGSKNTVDKYLKFLVLKGLITKQERFKDNGGQTSNSYFLHLDKGKPEVEFVPYQTLHPSPPQTLVGTPPQTLGDKPYKKNLIKLTNKKTDKKIISEDAVISKKQLDYAISKNILEPEAKLQFENFKDYSLAHGKPYADFNAAWRNWLRNTLFKPLSPKLTSSSGTKKADAFLEKLKKKKVRA